MPQVPRYNQPQAEDKEIPVVRSQDNVPDGIFGGGPGTAEVTKATQGLLKNGMDIYDAEKRKADEVAAQDIDLAAAAAESDLEGKAKSLQGKNAVAASDFVNAKWLDTSEAIRKMAKNDDQRAVAERVLKARFARLNQSVNSHISSELSKYDDELYKNAQKVYKEDASLHYSDPERVQQSLQDQDTATELYGRRKGLPREQIDAMKFDARSSTHVGILQRMIFDAKDDAAMAVPRAYEDAHKNEMTADDLGIVARAKQQGKQNRAAMREELMRGSYIAIVDAKNKGLPPEDAIRSIDKVFRNGGYSVDQRNSLVDLAMATYNSEEISATAKADKYLELAEKFRALKGVEFNEKGNLVSGPKGNSRKDIDAFQKEVAANAKYLTEEQALDFYTLLKGDPGDEVKNQFFGRLLETIKSLPNISPAMIVSVATRGMKIMDPKVTLQQANEITQKLKEEAIVAGNPEITRFPVGYRKKTKSGKYLEVTGHDGNGNATWNWAK